MAAIRKLIESVGGTRESIYFAFGSVDWYINVDLPSNAATVAATRWNTLTRLDIDGVAERSGIASPGHTEELLRGRSRAYATTAARPARKHRGRGGLRRLLRR